MSREKEHQEGIKVPDTGMLKSDRMWLFAQAARREYPRGKIQNIAQIAAQENKAVKFAQSKAVNTGVVTRVAAL